MKSLNPAQIAAKCVEISKSLVNTQVGLHGYDLWNTRSIGDASRLAVSIRQTETIDSDEKLASVAEALKIEFRVISSELLELFEKLGWVEIQRDGRRIKRVDEMIPPVEDVLSILGNKWEEDSPSKIDEGSVKSLSLLRHRPMTREAVLSEIGITEKDFNIIYGYGDQAQYLGSFVSPSINKEILWTPLYWSTNFDSVLSFLKKQSDENFKSIESLTKNIIKYPGRPKEQFSDDNKSILEMGIHFGYFPTPKIQNRQGKEFQYVCYASPQFETNPKKDIFEKARMIVACIRHGQYHADISKILYPVSLLRAMRNNRMKPHPYADVEYILLKLNGIIDIIPDKTHFGKAYRVKWIDSPENNLAGDIAEQLLKGEELVMATGTEELEARKILIQGMYNYTLEQRRISATKKFVAKDYYERLMELSLGVKL